MIVAEFVARHGLDQVGFLTLTFADHLLDPREASRRYNSLRTGVLSRRYPDVVKVFERQRSGRIHYHLLVACNSNIRRGVNFDAIRSRDYRTAGAALRSEWAFWRQTARRYRFGRCELLPIRKDGPALGRYIGKYVGKHVAHRQERDRRVRLVACSHRARAATTRFSWAGGRAAQWRAGVPRLLALLQECAQVPHASADSMREYFGKHWRYRFRRTIAAIGADANAPVGDDFWREVNREWEKVVAT